jgi:hypothetical protein
MWLQKKLDATRARNSAAKAKTAGRDADVAKWTQVHAELVAWAWQQVDSADAAEGGKVVEQSLMEIPSTTAAIRNMCDILDRKAFTAYAAQVGTTSDSAAITDNVIAGFHQVRQCWVGKMGGNVVSNTAIDSPA